MMIAPSSLMETAGCLCLASRRAARAITRTFDRALRPTGLRATQFSVLAILSLGGAKTIGQLADALGLERTTLTRNLAVIERRGWVKSRASRDDARARCVDVTAAGRAAVLAALPAWQQTQAAVGGAIGDVGANTLRRLARRSVH